MGWMASTTSAPGRALLSHRSDTGTGRVMGMNMDGKIKLLGSGITNICLTGQSTSHILYTQKWFHCNNLVHHFHVVFQVVLCFFNMSPGNKQWLPQHLQPSSHQYQPLTVPKSFQSIGYSENVNSIFFQTQYKMINGIVWQRRVGNSVGTSQQHLEWNVGNRFSQLAQSVHGSSLISYKRQTPPQHSKAST